MFWGTYCSKDMPVMKCFSLRWRFSSSFDYHQNSTDQLYFLDNSAATVLRLGRMQELHAALLVYSSRVSAAALWETEGIMLSGFVGIAKDKRCVALEMAIGGHAVYLVGLTKTD